MIEQYKEQKYLICFILSVMMLISCIGVTIGVDRQLNRSVATAYDETQILVETQQTGNGEAVHASSEPRIVEYATMVQPQILDAQSYEVLCRIVQAEAGCEDMIGKILVANVVLNRVEDERFPDTVSGVVFQYSGDTAQFSPVASGSYYTVQVTDETRAAVDRALAGEDYSEGALYFAARKAAGSQKMRWFDEHLTRLFAHGGHEFFI